MVVVIADPTNASDFSVGSRRRQLSRINVEGEAAAIRGTLNAANYSVTELIRPNTVA